MGLLAVDVSGFGVVMSADSQPVEILDGETRVLAEVGQYRTRNPIVRRAASGFRGLVGYVGTETIGKKRTHDWLSEFDKDHPDDNLATYANELARELSGEWDSHGLVSVLEILISGVEYGDVRFWFVRNSQGLYDHDWTHKAPSARFQAVNDLDDNYVPADLAQGETKEELLRRHLYSFRQGSLLPAAHVFAAFEEILQTIYAHRVQGFEPIASLDDLAFYSRQRMEFLKRLFSAQHGIYKAPPAPLGGKVHVLGVTRGGEIRSYAKGRNQVTTLLAAS